MAIRILFVSHTCLHQAARLKLLELTKLGYDVGLVLPSNWVSMDFSWRMPILANPIEKEITFFSAPVAFSGRPASHFYPPGWLGRVMQRFEPDIVQVEQEIFSPVSAEVAVWSKLRGTPLIGLGLENIQRRFCKVQHLFKKIVLARSSALICRNQEGANLTRKEGFRHPILITPLVGVNDKLFSSNLKKSSSDVFTIGFVGRMVYEKGGDVLIKAVKELEKRGIYVELLLVGDGNQKQYWQKFAKDIGICSNINWLGYQPLDKVAQVMSEMDVLVLPSRCTPTWKEQFGLVLAQAMMMGIPVIGSNCGAIPEVIGRNDIVFKEGDEFELSELLFRMIKEDDWREELACYSKKRARLNYSNEAIARKLDGLYHLILSDQEAS